MKAEIITIGDEILIGQTIDTNSAWLGEKLNSLGIAVHRITSIQDKRDEIINHLERALNSSDVVLITGGLGPTQDDITKSTLADFFDDHLERNMDVHVQVVHYFKSRNRPILESNEMQADLPSKCTPLMNTRGTAPGMWFEKKGVVFVSMPGVPDEMKGIFEHEVVSRLENLPGRKEIHHRVIMTRGIGESFLANILKDWEYRVRKSGLGLAYLPSMGTVKLRISSYAGDRKDEIDAFVEDVKPLIKDYLFADDEISLEKHLGEKLSKTGRTIAVAESCTGGTLSKIITAIPGASKYFLGGIISYDNRVKTKILNIPDQLLDEFGAVSEPVVKHMAEQVRVKFNADYAISTSGVAGPGGGTEEKPVGFVWCAIAGPNGTQTFSGKYGKTRSRIMKRVSIVAISKLLDEL